MKLTTSAFYHVEPVTLAQFGELSRRQERVPFTTFNAIASCYDNMWCDSNPLILSVASDEGKWIFPLRIERLPDETLVLRFYGHGLIDLMDCVSIGDIPVPPPPNAVASLIDFVGEHFPQAFLDLVGLSPDSLALQALQQWAQAADGARYLDSDQATCPVAVPLEPETASGANRTLRKRIARARRAEFVLVEPESPGEIQRSVDSLLAHHQQKWQASFAPRELFALQALVQAWRQEPWVRFPTLMASDGAIAAVLMVLSAGERRYLYIQSYDPKFTPMSPSRCAIAFYLSTMASRGVKVLDFLRGEESYKAEFCDRSYALRRLTIACDPALSDVSLAAVHDSFV